MEKSSKNDNQKKLDWLLLYNCRNGKKQNGKGKGLSYYICMVSKAANAKIEKYSKTWVQGISFYKEEKAQGNNKSMDNENPLESKSSLRHNPVKPYISAFNFEDIMRFQEVSTLYY